MDYLEGTRYGGVIFFFVFFLFRNRAQRQPYTIGHGGGREWTARRGENQYADESRKKSKTDRTLGFTLTCTHTRQREIHNEIVILYHYRRYYYYTHFRYTYNI